MPRWSKNPRDRLKVGRGVLRKHAVSKVWYFHFRGPDVQWKSVSTGHTDRAGATEWALGYGLNLTRLDMGLATPDEKVSNDPIRGAVDEWLKYIRTQRKAGTFRTYTSVLNNFQAYLAEHPKLARLDQFTQQEVLRYREWLLDRPLARARDKVKRARKAPRQNSKKTADNNLIVLRAFFNYCVALKKMLSNPIFESRQGVQVFFDERRPPIETYTRAEFAALIRHAPPEAGRKFRFLAASGLRIDELAHLELADLDFERGWLQVRTKTTHDGAVWSPKDKTDRKIPLNDELLAVLAELVPDADRAASQNRYVFPSTPGPWRAKNLARTTLGQLKRLSRMTGIPISKLTSHNFRRYFVSQCADCGIDIICVMEWVGHDDWEMVRRYYRLRDEHARSAMRRFTTGTPPGEVAPQPATTGNFGGTVGEEDVGQSRTAGQHRSQTPPAA